MAASIWKVTELRLFAIAYAGWLASYPLMMLLLPDYEIGSAAGLFVAVTLCALQILRRPLDLPQNSTVWLYLSGFAMVILLSQMFGNFVDLSMPAVLKSFAMIALLFVTACIATPRLFAMILPLYAVFLGIALLVVYLNGTFLWGRLSAGAQPNYWGLMALSGAIAALTVRRMPLKLFALGAAALIFYSTNSRGSMLGAFAALVTSAAVYFLVSGTRKKMILATVIMAVAVVGIGAELSTSFISQELLRVDDPNRGIDSGFSGRLEPWLYGLSLAMDRPFFGYGFRQSETYFGPALGISSAHNGYISMLIDAGLIGLFLYLLFLGHCLVAGYRTMRQMPLSYCALGFLAGYCVIGLFERYALNAGQPLSILFLASAFYILRGPERKYRSAAYAPARMTPQVVTHRPE
jgi:O-antigen ligase